MLDNITSSKIISPSLLPEKLLEVKNLRKKLVFTNGCFDIIHTGHTRYLREARMLGDGLIIAVNSDSSIRRLKGEKRPIVPLEERMEILAGFYFVDYVTPFDDDTPLNLIRTVQPEVLVKGGDWDLDQIVGKENVEQRNGLVTTIPEIPGASTTSIVERVLQRHQ